MPIKEFLKEYLFEITSVILIFCLVVFVIFFNYRPDPRYREMCVAFSQSNYSWNPSLLGFNGSCNVTRENVRFGDTYHNYYDCVLENGTRQEMDASKSCLIYAQARPTNIK